MKIIRICFVGLMLMAASCATMKNFPLVKDGKTASCIVLPDNAGPVEKHAAVELAAYLEKITGAKVETVASPSNEKYNIYIGTRGSKKLPLTSKMKSSADKLGEDGYMLAADAGGLRVVGQNYAGSCMVSTAFSRNTAMSAGSFRDPRVNIVPEARIFS